MVKRKFLSAVICLVTLMSLPGVGQAALVFYPDRPTFDAANPGLPVEGFEAAAPVTAGFVGPLDSSSNNGVFSPGDILPGVSFVDAPLPSDMFLAAPGQSSNPTNAIGANFPASDAMDILFSGAGVAAMAFDLFQNFGGGSQSGVPELYGVDIFGSGGLLASTTVTVPSGSAGFFGILSTTDLIVRVSINNTSAFEVIDNVAFGGTAVVPEPSSIALFALGLAGVGLGIKRRRNRRRA